eukprot:gene5215-3899_t
MCRISSDMNEKGLQSELLQVCSMQHPDLFSNAAGIHP